MLKSTHIQLSAFINHISFKKFIQKAKKQGMEGQSSSICWFLFKCSSQGYVSQVSTEIAGNQSTQVTLCCLPGCRSAGTWNWKQNQMSAPGNPGCDVGIPKHILTAVTNTCPIYHIFSLDNNKQIFIHIHTCTNI